MLNNLKAFLGRLRVRWHAVAAAMCTAFPVLLDQLGIIDLKPVLLHFTSEEYAALIVGLMPFVLAFLKPLVHLEPDK
jgi:hypothetical protein